MIKLVGVMHANPAIDREQALHYWLEVHSKTVAMLPGIKRYVLSPCVAAFGAGEPPFLGLAELWFDNREAAERALGSSQFHEAAADAARCFDMERGLTAWTIEREIV